MNHSEETLTLVPNVARAPEEIPELRKLSTERLIIWVIGKGRELGMKLTPEQLVLECWLINPEKH